MQSSVLEVGSQQETQEAEAEGEAEAEAEAEKEAEGEGQNLGKAFRFIKGLLKQSREAARCQPER